MPITKSSKYHDFRKPPTISKIRSDAANFVFTDVPTALAHPTRTAPNRAPSQWVSRYVLSRASTAPRLDQASPAFSASPSHKHQANRRLRRLGLMGSRFSKCRKPSTANNSSSEMALELARACSWSFWVVWGDSFGINFLQVSQIPANSYFATRITRKPLSYYFRPPILASKINQTIMCFQNRFLDLLFSFLFLIKMIDVGTPSKSDGYQNGGQNQPSGATMAPTNVRCASSFFSNTVFTKP